MATVNNDYNTAEGEPIVRIGNWAEERALLECSGYARGSTQTQSTITKAHLNTALRTIAHPSLESSATSAQEWKSSTHKDWEEGRGGKGTERIAPIQSSRQQLREAAAWKEAMEKRDLEEAKKKEEESNQLIEALYGNRIELNKKKILERPDNEEKLFSSLSSSLPMEPSLADPAITIHNTLLLDESQRADIQAKKGMLGVHNKRTAFSQPIGESKGSLHHQHGE